MIPWTVAHQAPLSVGFPRQEYWSGLPCPPPEDLPDPGIKLTSPALHADSLPLSHLGSPLKGGFAMYLGHLTRVIETLPAPYLCTSPSAQCVDLSSLLLKPRLTALSLARKALCARLYQVY